MRRVIICIALTGALLGAVVGCGVKKSQLQPNEIAVSVPVVEQKKVSEGASSDLTIEKIDAKEQEKKEQTKQPETGPVPEKVNPAATQSQVQLQPQPQKPEPDPAPGPKSPKALPEIHVKYSFEYLQSVENDIVALCNQERAKVGAKPLVMSETLRQSARYKSDEMLQYNYFDHVSPVSGLNPWDLAKKFGYSYTTFGENIWYGQGYSKDVLTAKMIVNSWMNSPGHKANILNPKFGHIGVGVVLGSSNKKSEATQQFSN